jgi:hypothetical protein
MSALITVADTNGTINDAKVTISRTGFSSEKISGQKLITFTDWSGSQFESKSNYMATPSGSLLIGQIDGKYATSSAQWLVSNTIDFGTNDTTFSKLEWLPTIQPPTTGTDSLKIQIAVNNDNSTWNFVGPDGTAGSFYTASGTNISPTANNNRYLRYKIILNTIDETATPSLDDLTIYFHSGCIPDGQAFFSGLDSGTYTITVEKTGYQTFNFPGFAVNNNWQFYKAILIH